MSEKITMQGGKLCVPENPIVPFIEGDGIGPDITAAAMTVWNAAVEKAYGGKRKIEWKEVLAGEKAFNKTGEWLPQETLDVCRDCLVSIKGPLTTPVGGGIRSINVAMRQELDLHVCLRPVRWFKGVPSPVKRPELTDMVIFRENTEDIYAGIEWMHGTAEVEKVKAFLLGEMGVKKIRFPQTASIGIKPVSLEGTERLVKAAIIHNVVIGKDNLATTNHRVVNNAVFAIGCHSKHIVVHKFVQNNNTLLRNFVNQLQVALVLQCLLVLHFFAGVHHFVQQNLFDGRVIATQKPDGIIDNLAVLLLGYGTNTGRTTTAEVVVQAGAKI